MNVSLYHAAAALDANSRWQDVISQNLASGSIPGYKRQDVSFSAIAAGKQFAPAEGGAPTRLSLPTMTASTSFMPGPIRPTSGKTDFAIEGDGFFQVTLPDGKIGYTRDGEFQIDASGALVTKDGFKVVGSNGPIQMDPNNGQPLTVGSTGEVSQGLEPKGKLTVTQFNDPSKLTPVPGGYFIAEDPKLLPAESAALVRQGYLETSNASVVGEMANMISAMRAFELNQKVIHVADDRMQRAITELSPNS